MKYTVRDNVLHVRKFKRRRKIKVTWHWAILPTVVVVGLLLMKIILRLIEATDSGILK
jgi:ABC-type tungstate transport system substrate-binding protein